MNLAQVFGDDEHTAADGVYSRLIKSRKWVYLAATAAGLHALGGINYLAITKLTGGLISLPSRVGGLALAAGLAVVLAQYILLLCQARYAYPPLVKERLSLRVQASMDAVGQELRGVGDELAKTFRKMQALDENALASAAVLSVETTWTTGLGDVNIDRPLIGDLQAHGGFQRHVSEYKAKVSTLLDAQRGVEVEKARSYLRDYATKRMEAEREIEVLSFRRDLLAENHAELARNAPEARSLFRAAEYGMDGIRILVPAAIGLAALAHLIPAA